MENKEPASNSGEVFATHIHIILSDGSEIIADKNVAAELMRWWRSCETMNCIHGASYKGHQPTITKPSDVSPTPCPGVSVCRTERESAVRAEREACAKIADSFVSRKIPFTPRVTAEQIAEKIRERGNAE